MLVADEMIARRKLARVFGTWPLGKKFTAEQAPSKICHSMPGMRSKDGQSVVVFKLQDLDRVVLDCKSMNLEPETEVYYFIPKGEALYTAGQFQVDVTYEEK
jgi:hypothetical protein